MNNKTHWENVYNNKSANTVSWFQEHASLSLEMIEQLQIPLHSHIIDIGGGASTLVDDLLQQGYSQIQVLDLSAKALEVAKTRLGNKAQQVNWLVNDITDIQFPADSIDLWHDRAVFHFLTETTDQKKYINTLKHGLKSNGHLLIATFVINGPEKCSGLKIQQHDAQSLQNLLGSEFELVTQQFETHETPFATQQKFIYCLFRKR